MTSYYVYYRIEAHSLATLRPRVEALFGAIEHATGVRGRWMRRRDGSATCMEVYENVPDETVFEALLEREGARVVPGLVRHVERFVCA